MSVFTTQPSRSPSTSRRRFLQVGAASGGGLLIGFSLFGCASKLPAPKTVKLEDAGAYTLIGKAHKRLDSPAKVNGTALFGIDARLPNMAVATVAASPVPGGTLPSADEAKAMAVKGGAPGSQFRDST